MMFETMSSWTARILFTISFLLLAVSIVEAGVRQMGFTILRLTFSPGRLLEYAAILLVFVVAILLRQIRDGVKAT